MNKYFYGHEDNKYRHLDIPMALLTERFRELTGDAKILYGLLLNRISLSRKNNWVDEENRIYIIFTREEAMNTLFISDKTCTKAFKLLIKHDLIEEIKQGLNKPNLIYVKEIVLEPENTENRKNYDLETEENTSQEEENLRSSGVVKSTIQERKNLRGNYTNNNYTNNNYTDLNNNNIGENIGKCNTDISKTVVAVKKDIENTIKTNMSTIATLDLLAEKGEEKIRFYLKHWNKFKVKKHNVVGFFLDMVKREYKIPEESKQENCNNYKPPQATNFEQREYDDDYFESLYENAPYVDNKK